MKNRVIGVLLILLIIVAAVFIAPKVIKTVKYAGEGEEPEGFTFSVDEYENNLVNTPSDIEGWTMLDKVKAGLQPMEGTDSDADGLTDKEEIEIYGSDPAKTSTSGDLYPDGYKVENGLDLNTAYEYKNEFSFENNACSEVELTAVEASDFNAVVEKIENTKISGYDIYLAYNLYHFAGNFSIDVSDILSDDMSAKDLTVLVGPWHDGEMEKPKTSLSGNIITVDYSFDKNKTYTVAVVKSNSVFNMFKKPYHSFSLNSTGDMDLADTDFIYVHPLPVLNFFVNNKPKMYYVSTGSTKNDARIVNYLLALADGITDGNVEVTDEDCKAVSSTKMTALKNTMRHFTEHEIASSQDGIEGVKWVFCWCEKVIADESEYLANVTDIRDNTAAKQSSTGFDVNKDALAFQNFSTEYVMGGNCAGIAYYTAELYNKKTAPSSGNHASSRYENGATSITWDISSDGDNKTLTDPGINDYKDSSFVANHGGAGNALTGLTEGEREFTKMISSYFALANDALSPENHIYYMSDTVGIYDWELIEKMEDYLDKGQILILGMMDNKSGGHAINVVDYKQSEDGETVYFTLYDNNYPGNTRKGNFIDNTLVVKKASFPEGRKESFTYYYKPYDSAKREYSSENNENGWKSFMVMDSNLNVLEY